jgi:hypothetical protein
MSLLIFPSGKRTIEPSQCHQESSGDGHEAGGNRSTLSTLAGRRNGEIRTESELATIAQKKP